jgi:peptidoglycan/xylan/chitin deacetylase (PgdA/CDA1 family)
MTQIVPILLYHSVDDTCAPAYRGWTVGIDRFRSQMEHLSRRGCEALTVSEYIRHCEAGASLKPRTVLITFDDGLRDFATGALPILERHGFPATLFVATRFVGGRSEWLGRLGEGSRPMLTWQELSELPRRGIELGAHSRSHPELDTIPLNDSVEEIEGSKVDLERALGIRVTSFAYPHGYSSRSVRNEVRRLGFAAACRVRHALSSTDEDRFALSRIIVSEGTTGEALDELLEGRGLPVAPSVERPASHLWRFARKLRRAARAH